MDDSKSVVLSLPAETTITGWPGKTFRPTLNIRYREKRLASYVKVGMAPRVELEDGATCRVRLDKRLAKTLVFGESESKTALFWRNVDIEFLVDLLTHNSMLFEFTPFNSSPVQTTFDLRGLANVIGPLLLLLGTRIELLRSPTESQRLASDIMREKLTKGLWAPAKPSEIRHLSHTGVYLQSGAEEGYAAAFRAVLDRFPSAQCWVTIRCDGPLKRDPTVQRVISAFESARIPSTHYGIAAGSEWRFEVFVE